MKRLVVISLTLLVLLSASFTGSAVPVYGDGPSTSEATLIVQKWISNDEIELGQSITVNVNITNLSKAYAYNLTIEEPSFNNFIVDSKRDYSLYKYVAIGSGAVITYEYTITPEVKGEFKIQPTTVEYVNVNNTAHLAKSSEIPFQVYEDHVPQETEELWNNVLWLALPFAIVPIVVYYANEYFKR